MTTYTTTMTSNGQITIPKELRELFNFHPGSRIKIHSTKNTLKIERQQSLQEIIAEMDAIPFSKKTQALIKKNAGKTVNELKEEFANSPEGKAYFKEKYGI